MNTVKKLSPAESRKSVHQFYMVELIKGKYKGETVRVGELLKDQLIKDKKAKLLKEDTKSKVEQ